VELIGQGMVPKSDLSNVAYSFEYKDYRDGIIGKTYHKGHKTDEEVFEDNNLKLLVEYYRAEGRNFCAYVKVYNRDNELLHGYFSLDDFIACEYIEHSNGLDYLFYKEDLYGYSVLELSTKRVFDYYPAATFKDNIETFIATSVHYNRQNNIAAVEGCFWACPWDVLLLQIDNPMERFTKMVSVGELLSQNSVEHNHINFIAWENNDIRLEVTSGEAREAIVLTQAEYRDELRPL
jgi:hypothetical protein